MIVTPNKKLVCHFCNKIIDKNHLSTPVDIFSKCENIWNRKITFDLCATSSNTMCSLFFTEKHDYLKLDVKNPNFVYWINPPHDKTKMFVIKAYQDWLKNNVEIIMLIPINTLCSNYSEKYILPFAKVHVLTGRIKFCCPHCGTPTKLNSVNGYVTIFYEKRNA